MNNSAECKNIAIWISEKKSHKLNWKELIKACRDHGYNLVKVDIDKPLEEQGHFDVLLHKLTDVIAAADLGDKKAAAIVRLVEQYVSNHPRVAVIDPLQNVRILLNRHCYYSILQEELTCQYQGLFTPKFAEFTTNNIEQNIEILKQRGVTFPVICKPTVAHGSKLAHEMVVIFNKKGLSVCKPPCVVQSFVNHNAVLHKVFLIGNRYHICERPSLKNFYSSDELEPIFYTTGEVCKADSQSTLSILDPYDKTDIKMTLNEDKIRCIIKILKKRIGLLLAGFDVVIDNLTGDHAVIDINVFPSYDNFPNFFEHLLDCVDECVFKNVEDKNGGKSYDVDNVKNDTFNGMLNVGVGQVKYGIRE